MLTKKLITTYAIPFLWFIAIATSFFLLHPRLGITDVDSEAYLMGAHSLEKNKAYVDPQEKPLNHWPPGYSWLISHSSEPKNLALIINGLSLGIAAAAVGCLALYSGWSVVGASALVGIVGFGFLHDLSPYLKPDIFAYSVFLIGVLIYLRGGNLARFSAFMLWSLLIPFKLIAIVFVPAVLFSEYLQSGKSITKHFLAHWAMLLGSMFFWAICLGGVIFFNIQSTGEVVGQSHSSTTISILGGEILRFFHASLRSGLVGWYGSIRDLEVLLPFLALLILGIISLASLRPSRRGAILLWMGGSILLFSWLLLCLRVYYAGPRLMGYGLLLIVAGMLPLKNRLGILKIFALGTILFTFYNTMMVSRLGVNHPLYEKETKKIEKYIVQGKKIFSNAPSLIQVHLAVPSTREPLTNQPLGAQYIEFTFPNYDGIAQPITEPLHRDSSWKKSKEWKHAVLYEKTNPVLQ